MHQGRLKIKISSEVVPGPRVEESRAKVEKIKRLITGAAYHPAVTLEGGTGLLKLHNILRGDARRQDTPLDFGLDEDGSFFVIVKLPFSVKRIEQERSYESAVGRR